MDTILKSFVIEFFEHLTLFSIREIQISRKQSTIFNCIDLFPYWKRTTWYDRCPTKTGKTMLLKEIANAIAANHPRYI
jgi:transcription termination factor Rho